MIDETKANVVSLDAWTGRIMCPACNPETRRRPFFEGHCIVCDEDDTTTAPQLARVVGQLMRKLDEAESDLEDAQSQAELATSAYDRVVARWESSVAAPLERAASELGLVPTTDVASAVLRECEQARRAVGQAWFAGGATLTEAIERKCAALEAAPTREGER